MAGNVNLGEYGEARGLPNDITYQRPGGVIRPVKTA